MPWVPLPRCSSSENPPFSTGGLAGREWSKGLLLDQSVTSRDLSMSFRAGSAPGASSAQVLVVIVLGMDHGKKPLGKRMPSSQPLGC